MTEDRTYVRLRHLLSNELSADQTKSLQGAEQVSFVPMESIGEKGELDLSTVRPKVDVSSGYTLFFDGDVLVAKITPCFENGKGAIARGLYNGVGFGTTELHVLRPKPDVDPQFLYYITTSSPFRLLGESFMTGAAGQKRVPSEFVNNYQLALPPFRQQRAIADYLDRKTAVIDDLLAEKQHLLEVLAEKRQALITQAVTRGLDGDVTLRDSGVEWLGEIPAHWEAVRIKYISQIGNGSTPLRSNDQYWIGGDFPWVTSTVVNADVVGEPSEFVTRIALRDCHLPIVPPDSVLVALTGEGKTRGLSAILPYQATINQHLAFITPDRHRLDSSYLQVFLSAHYEVLRAISEGAGSTRAALTCAQLNEFPVALPPLQEQKKIVASIFGLVENLDDLVKATQDTINLLQERRTALIAAAVTGQIEVTE